MTTATLNRPPEPSQAQPRATQLVIFTIAGEDYGLPIQYIQEVIRYAKPRSIISPDPWVTGVVDLRGKIVPVCDLAARLGLSSESTDDRKVMILETEAGTAGMIVDAVDQVVMVEHDQLERSAAANREMVAAIARIEERLVVVLNAGALVVNAAVDGTG